MQSFNEILDQIRDALPPPDEFDEEALSEIEAMYLEEFLGICGSIRSVPGAQPNDLSAQPKAFFHWLCYAQSISSFFNSLAWDGFLSVFYNGTGEGINALCDSLKRFEDPLSPLVEEAYALLAPSYCFIDNSNFITRNEGADPYESIPTQVGARIEEIEQEVIGLQGECYDLVCAAYKKAYF